VNLLYLVLLSIEGGAIVIWAMDCKASKRNTYKHDGLARLLKQTHINVMGLHRLSSRSRKT
jgi:hypothetical protein